jgi:hypothetical protein
MRIDTTPPTTERRRRSSLLAVCSLALLAGLAWSAAEGQEPGDPWDDAWGDETPTPTGEASPTPAAGDTVTPSEGGFEPPTGGFPPIEEPGPAIPPPPGDDVGEPSGVSGVYLYMPNIAEGLRYLGVFLALLVGYFLPTIFYSNLLRNTRMAPGPAAALCVGIGGLATVWVIPLLFARQVFADGHLVAWYLQGQNWAWAGGYFAFFLILAVLGAMSSGGSR